jgi:CheY-like chemotaxis protein
LRFGIVVPFFESYAMSKTAILIDDDRDDLEFLEEAIKQVDHSVKCIPYLFCDDALRKILNDPSLVPNYIFIDMNMPRWNGNQCLKELRNDPKLKNVPITMLSTSMPPPVAEVLKENGANFTFEKPKNFDDYEQILKLILN